MRKDLWKLAAAVGVAALVSMGCMDRARTQEGTGGSGPDPSGTAIPAPDAPADVINGPSTPTSDQPGTGGSGTISEDGAVDEAESVPAEDPLHEPDDLNPTTWDPLESTCRHASLSIL